jgi:hypothetical protein
MADQRRIYELVSSIVLDPQISLQATADACLIIDATQADELQALSIARGEAWRQLRARNIFADDLPVIDPLGDPVAGLTLLERTALELSVRFKLKDDEVARVMEDKPKRVQHYVRTARRELARTAIAGALLTNTTKCPVINEQKESLGATINRGEAMTLVSHSAECSICVPVLRTVDRQILQNYIDVPVAEVPSELAQLLARDAAPLVERARLVHGYAPLDDESRIRPRALIKRAVIFGAISAALVAAALFVAR